MSAAPRLALRGVAKRYGSTTALAGLDLELHAGRVLALLGQNGAGKSTAVRIGTGVESADAGHVELDGVATRWRSACEARAHGVHAVAQELALVPHLRVEEALHLGRLPTFGPFVARRRLRSQALRALARTGLVLDPASRMGDHPPAVRALVAIAAALDAEARVLFLDEPTASLDRAQALELLGRIRALRAQGVALVYVGHRLDEVLAVADDVVVLRDGRVALAAPAAGMQAAQLAAAVVGRPLHAAVRAEAEASGGARLVARGLSSDAPLAASNFELRPGRVAGVAGLLGSGRSELCRTLAGDARRQGRLELDGRALPHGVAGTMDRGLVQAPEERRHDGLWLDLSIEETVALGLQRRGGPRAAAATRRVAEELVARLGIKCASVDAPVRTLSGGNQQKVLLARLLAAGPAVLVLDEPTRGVDVGARADIVARVRDVAGQGACVLWTTSHLEELQEVADDVLVVRGNAVVEQAARAALDLDRVLARMAGADVAPADVRGKERSA